MRSNPIIKSPIASAVAAAIATALASSSARADEPVTKAYQIAAQPVSAALKELAAQSDMQLIYTESDVGQAQTTGIKGAHSTREALSEILKGTGLEYEITANDVIVVHKAGARTGQLASINDDIRLAQADNASAPAPESGPPTQSSSQADESESLGSLEEIVVTATRRSESIQKIPFNISAIDGAQIAAKGLAGLSDLLRETPGVFAVDGGRGQSNEIVARGLSVGGTAEPGFARNDTGGVVSTYVGEIPVFVDLRLNDLERVEVLLGPQGTLYGAGTLGGAIRYIPRKPKFDATELSVNAEGYGYSESNGIGSDTSLTFNLPIAENLAFRGSVDYLDDPGFIDFNFLVRKPGVSDVQPDFTNPADVAANLRSVRDANKERTLFARGALRWKPIDALDATLSFYFQDQQVDARTENNRGDMGTGRYESASRFLEFDNRRNKITSLEVTADLGFAELTSATGYTDYAGRSLHDQTDLLMNISLSYAQFPNFADFSPWQNSQDRFSQEVRLVSKSEGPLGWIAGVFYDKKNSAGSFPEYAPGFSQFALDNLGWQGVLRPDALEFDDRARVHQKEQAAFGELSYKITDAWKVVGGTRWYDYKQTYAESTDAPMYYTSYFDPNGPYADLWRPPNDVKIAFNPQTAKNHGWLFKASTSYEFTDDVMGYFTRSEGYRIGSTNGFPLCTPTTPANKPCAQPDELVYRPDTTVNYELGVHSQWLGRRLTVNGSLFYVDWTDPQLAGATAQGAGGITKNGKGAKSQGVDLAVYAAVTNRLRISANYSFTDAKLTADAPNLMRNIYLPGEQMVPNANPDVCTPQPDGTGLNPNSPFSTKCYPVDGKEGDRLPHSPRHQGSLNVNYTQPFGQQNLVFHYGVTAISNVLTEVGGRASGETLGGYALHSASMAWESDNWTVGLYADNLFNKFAKTDIARNRRWIQAIPNDTIPGVEATQTRNYDTRFVIPRQYGLRFSYNFDL